MFKIGKTLGNIANIKFPDSGFFDKNLEVRNILSAENLVSFCKSILADNKVKITIPQKQIDQIRNIFKIYKNLLPDGTERNLVHADFDPANILIVENNGQVEVSGILDWEFSFSGSTLWDIANMLRYAHHMPRDYKDSFLQGLISTGYTLPSSWQITINLLNIISLLDSLQRTTIEDRPNQVKDIQELISYILDDLSKIEVVPYKQNTLR